MSLRSLFISSLAVVTLCLCSISSASAASYVIDSGHSGALFKVQHIGLGYTYGRFNTFSGTINFDAEDLANASINLSIQVASIDSNDKKRDDHLRNADFFDAGTHPEMTFTSTAFKAVDGKADTYAITGDLSIRGSTKSITIEAKKIGQGIHGMTKTAAIGFETSFTIDRTAFGVGQGKVSAYVGKDVHITVGLEAIVPKQ